MDPATPPHGKALPPTPHPAAVADLHCLSMDEVCSKSARLSQRSGPPEVPLGRRLHPDLSGAWLALSSGCLQAAASTASPQSNGQVPTGGSGDLQRLPPPNVPWDSWRGPDWNPFADIARDASAGTSVSLLQIPGSEQPSER